MKLNPIAANQTEVTFRNGTSVLFSYQTPVAAFVPGVGHVRTSTNYSRTTSRHINAWLDGVEGVEVDQSKLDNLVGSA